MNDSEVILSLLEEARQAGAEHPAFTGTTDGSAVITDAQGLTWKVKLEALG